MTKIIFYRNDGIYYGFREEGHSGYAEAGDDVVCAAISAMTMLIINTIEDSYEAHVDYDINEDDTIVTCRSKAALPEFEEDARKRFAISGLFLAYYRTLQNMVEDDYEYLEVSVEDAEYGKN